MHSSEQTKNKSIHLNFKWILAFILLFSLLTKIPRLDFPENFYFDEVYHGFTGTQYLKNNPDAYDPWAKSPPGRAFEWTHPPLAKLIMAGFMGIFGENSFGWRIGSVLFGTAAVLLTALIALELFGSVAIAGLAAFFLSIEGLVFTQSRIAMNDAYFIFFALSSAWSYIRWRKGHGLRFLYLAGAMLGLAAATKWTTVYFFGIYGIDLLRTVIKNPKQFFKFPIFHMILAFLILPTALYLLTYLQFFLMGNTFDRFITIQQQMWWYHSQLKATHSYQSKPWQWVFNLRPVWMHVSSTPSFMSNIYNIGNSIILIGGLVAIALTLWKDKLKNWDVWFALLAYFLLWVPWVFSPRIMLFYHYMPAVPFLCILLARTLVQNSRKATLVFSVLALTWFVIFYPHNTAMPVPKEFGEALYFLVPSWR